MDISSEVANIHMRTNAKNLVITARTIRKPVQEVFMISLTFQPKIAWQTASQRHQLRRTI